MKLTKELLLKAGPRRQTVTVPDHGTVTVRGLTAAEAMEFHKRQVQDVAKSGYYLLAAGVLDEAGGQMFAIEDADAMSGIGAQVVEQLVSVVLELSGMRVPVTAEKK